MQSDDLLANANADTYDVPTDSDQVCKMFSQLQQVLYMVTRLKCSGVWSVTRNIRVNIKMATVA